MTNLLSRRLFLRQASAAPIAATVAAFPDIARATTIGGGSDAALLARRSELVAAWAALDQASLTYSRLEDSFFQSRGAPPVQPRHGWQSLVLNGEVLPTVPKQEWTDYDARMAAVTQTNAELRRDMGVDAAELATTDANEVVTEIAEAILETPAHTTDGMRFKATLVNVMGAEDVLASISRDLEALGDPLEIIGFSEGGVA